MLRVVRAWLAAAFRRDTLERDMQAEMREHIERATERFLHRGLAPAEAAREARREFGNVAYLQEEARDARGGRWLEELRRDARYCLRSLIKTPAFTIVAVVSLALGVGVNTAVFTMLRLALMPSPVDSPESLVTIANSRSFPAFLALRDGVPSLEHVFARSWERVLVGPRSAGDQSGEAAAQFVSSEFFVALRARPLIGRVIDPSENAAPVAEPVAVLSHHFWRSHFNADSSVIGRPLRLVNGLTLRIVGVMPFSFAGADRHVPDFWLPLGMRPYVPGVSQPPRPSGDWFSGSQGWLRLHGRIADGQTIERVRAQAGPLLLRFDADSTLHRSRPEMQIETAAQSGINSAGERLTVAMVMAATFVVLLIACANTANLLLARAAARHREIAVRLCLGASRARLVQQLLVECALLALGGGVAAILIVGIGLPALVLSGTLGPISGGNAELTALAMRPDLRMLIFTSVISILSAIAFGLAPALHASRPDLARAVKAESMAFGDRVSRTRLRNVLVVAQVALSLVLLVSASVLVRSVRRAVLLDTGFARDRVLAVEPSGVMVAYDSVRMARFDEAFAARLASHPAAARVARGHLPLLETGRALFKPVMSMSDGVDGNFAVVNAEYFEALGIPIVRGRAFTVAEERASRRAGVAIISAATAAALWPNDDPIGKSLSIEPGGKSAQMNPESQVATATVIGVARDAQMVALGRVPAVFGYVPGGHGTLLVRAAGDVATAKAALSQLARSIDADVPVSIATLDELISGDENIVRGAQLAAGFAAALGALALTLAAVGLFGVISYSVSQRIRELGIRAALGASPVQIVTLVLRQGGRIVGIGAAIGLLGGGLATRLLEAMLFGMSPLDPLAYLQVALVLTGVALVACYLPARRATRIDPLAALRCD